MQKSQKSKQNNLQKKKKIESINKNTKKRMKSDIPKHGYQYIKYEYLILLKIEKSFFYIKSFRRRFILNLNKKTTKKKQINNYYNQILSQK